MDAEFKEKVEGFFEEMVQRTLTNSLAARLIESQKFS